LWGFLVKLANSRALTAGIFFLLLGGAGFLMPNSVWNENSRGTFLEDLTVPEIYELCNSGLGQLGKAFSSDVREACGEIKLMSYGIYGVGLLGIILIVVGAVTPKKNT
jgi:hypothetical protein